MNTAYVDRTKWLSGDDFVAFALKIKYASCVQHGDAAAAHRGRRRRSDALVWSRSYTQNPGS